MAIAEQFTGLDMKQLIGAPLRAAADASTQLANSTAEFINRVGFDSDGKVRTVAFGYQKRSVNEDGTSNLDEMKVDVPMLAIVPIPNLQVDEVNVLFDMEVKQSERQESALDLSATVSGTVNLGIVKVNVTGSVSAHQSNTRSSDNSAKYHVDIRATNHGTPEGLARVLDMMAANVAPMLVDSTLKDGNGKDLSEQARIKAERLKALRYDMSRIEGCLNAANDSLSGSIMLLKKVASEQQNAYREKMARLQSEVEDEKSYKKRLEDAKEQETKERLEKERKEVEAKELARNQNMDEINQSFSRFQNQVGDYVKLIADSGSTSESVSKMFALKALDEEGNVTEYGAAESQYETLAEAQKRAVESQIRVSDLEKQLCEKKTEYSDAISGTAPALTEKSTNA